MDFILFADISKCDKTVLKQPFYAWNIDYFIFWLMGSSLHDIFQQRRVSVDIGVMAGPSWAGGVRQIFFSGQIAVTTFS